MATRGCGYSPEEDAVIRATYPSGGPGACAELLDRSQCSIQCRARKLGVRCRTVRRERWTEEQERYCLSQLVSMSRLTGHRPLSIIRHVETMERTRMRET